MKFIYLLFLFILWNFSASAQDLPKPTIKTRSFAVDKNSVVKDSTGKVLPFKQWSTLMRTKEYVLWPENFEDADPSFILKKKASKDARYATQEVAEAAKQPEKQLTPEEIEEQNIASMPPPGESENFTVGEEMQPFSVHDLNGNKIKLKDLRGKIVVIDFWFIACHACILEFPELNKLVDTYKGNPNVVFLGFALDYNYDLKQFLKKTPFNYNIIGDSRRLAESYNMKYYPTSLVLNKEGKVAFHTSGFAPNSVYWLRKTIDENLK